MNHPGPVFNPNMMHGKPVHPAAIARAYARRARLVPRAEGLPSLRPDTVRHALHGETYVVMRDQALALLEPGDWIEVVW